MTATLLDRLAERFQSTAVSVTPQTPLAVALSGGVDSVLLLAVVHRLYPSARLRCIHVDHQLHQDSPQWAQFCVEYAADLGVEIKCLSVDIDARRDGLEAAAREARYAAIAQAMYTGEFLLTAHHADDQLETLLYRLVRGTGVAGLRGIRAFEAFGPGYLMRPFLNETRATILSEAQALGLRWLEDPSNENPRFDRNYLRQAVLPAVLARWPLAGQAAMRFASAAGDSAELAEVVARDDLIGIDALDCLPLDRLATLTPARLRNALRYAIAEQQLPMPSAAALERVCALIADTARLPVAQWPGAEVHCFAGSMYLQPAARPVEQTELELTPEQACRLDQGTLALEPAEQSPAVPDAWVREGLRVRFRSGGEQFHAAGRPGSQPLREWLRTREVLPWMRDRLPLVYRGNELVAVADLGVSAAAAEAAGSQGGWCVRWHDRPRVS
jgi:tRNA(Ile)-lysidine synthase